MIFQCGYRIFFHLFQLLHGRVCVRKTLIISISLLCDLSKANGKTIVFRALSQYHLYKELFFYTRGMSKLTLCHIGIFFLVFFLINAI